jgi:hypothetical protein
VLSHVHHFLERGFDAFAGMGGARDFLATIRRRESVINQDVISSLPVTRAYGSLLNVTPGLTVDNNGLAATPTMTFFSAHGGNTNEGRMLINGMTVAAAFNGGGVSSLTYDTNNAEEVSVGSRVASVSPRPAARA